MLRKIVHYKIKSELFGEWRFFVSKMWLKKDADVFVFLLKILYIAERITRVLKQYSEI